MRINREEFLGLLNRLQPGLSPQAVIEQSDTFVFRNGRIYTYNDEISCRAKSPAGEIEMAVAAAPLLALLSKMAEDEIDVEPNGAELRITGKRRRAGIRAEAQITCPVDNVEKPGEWKLLHPEFIEAVNLVQGCAGRDESAFALTCVHVHPKWIEACDNRQITRYRLKTGFAAPTLVRRESLRHVVSLGAEKFCETETWLHFRCHGGLIFSCRRFVEDYPDLGQLLEIEGAPASLPKGLAEAAERARVFAAENAEFDDVTIKLVPGKLVCRGEGTLGWFSESKKIKYSGRELEFTISPAILAEVVKRHTDVVVSENRLKVAGGKWDYVTSLGIKRGAR